MFLNIFIFFCLNAIAYNPTEPLKGWDRLIIKDYSLIKEQEEKLKQRTNTEKGVGLKENFLDGLRYFMAGGVWSGGGGTSLICGSKLDQEFATARLEKINVAAYQSIDEINPLDYFSALSDSMILPVQADKSSIQYLNRVLMSNYSEFAPLFTLQLLTLSQVIYNELQNQIKLYNPKIERTKVEPLLLDYGSASLSLFQQSLYIQNCKFLQLATRYTKYQAFKLYPFFITFDVFALIRMKETSPTDEVYIAKEASLILHEALYLLGSAIGVGDASVISWGALPFLLSKKTQEQLVLISGRKEKSKWFRKQLVKFGMDRYNLLHLSLQNINPQDMLKSKLLNANQELSWVMNAVESSYQNIINPIQARKSNSFNDKLYDRLMKKSSDEAAFVVFVTQIIDLETQQFTIDDLYLEQQDLGLVIDDFCNALKNSIVFKNSTKNKITKRALRFCESQNSEKAPFRILPEL